MRTPLRSFSQTYQLVLHEDGQGVAQTIEFEASSPDAALFVAERQCRGRQAELFENDRSLGRLQCAAHGGYWILLSPESVAQA
jgi:hypothetical protein